MNFSDFPFLRYLPFFLGGILISKTVPELPWEFFFPCVFLLWVIYALRIRISNPFSPTWSGVLAYLILFVLGLTLGLHHKKSHTPTLDWEGVDSYLAEVSGFDIPKANSSENLLEVLAVRACGTWQKNSGKVLIYHKGSGSLRPGDVVWINKIPETIPPPSFPDEFDYRDFLAKKGIHYRQRIREDFFLLDTTGIEHPRFAVDRLGHSLAQLIQSHIQNPESRQIAWALLLGQKVSLDEEIRDAYSQTGTMHILAVSGLHVGIIYAILLLPCRALKRNSKIRFYYLILVVLIIWIYALLTGFSPSVVRAAAMFSLMTFGQLRKRKTSVWNILAFSAMLILTADPDVVFDIGFQLSYLAVAGIVGIQPMMLDWWLPKNSLVEYFWQLATVSLAAQLVTFPLSVLYFHQFPTYFLPANLLVVPLSFLVMVVGVPFLILGWLPGLGEVLGWVVNWLIFAQNYLTSLIQFLPGGTIERITISFSGIFLVWGLLFIWGNWELGNRKKLVFMGILLFGMWRIEQLVREINKPECQLWLFKNQKGTLVDIQIGERTLSWNQSFPPDQISFSVDPNRVEEERFARPLPLKGMQMDSLIWFPGLDLRLFTKNGEIQWVGSNQ